MPRNISDRAGTRMRWLIEQLKREGNTAKEIARRTGLDATAVSHITADRRNLGLDLMYDVATSLGLRYEFFMGDYEGERHYTDFVETEDRAEESAADLDDPPPRSLLEFMAAHPNGRTMTGAEFDAARRAKLGVEGTHAVWNWWLGIYRQDQAGKIQALKAAEEAESYAATKRTNPDRKPKPMKSRK